jgi:hypothetical protein
MNPRLQYNFGNVPVNTAAESTEEKTPDNTTRNVELHSPADALHKAAAAGDVSQITTILSNDPDAINRFHSIHQTTPICWALDNNQDAAVELLMTRGADFFITAHTYSFYYPLHYMRYKGTEHQLKIFKGIYEHIISLGNVQNITSPILLTGIYQNLLFLLENSSDISHLHKLFEEVRNIIYAGTAITPDLLHLVIREHTVFCQFEQNPPKAINLQFVKDMKIRLAIVIERLLISFPTNNKNTNLSYEIFNYAKRLNQQLGVHLLNLCFQTARKLLSENDSHFDAAIALEHTLQGNISENRFSSLSNTNIGNHIDFINKNKTGPNAVFSLLYLKTALAIMNCVKYPIAPVKSLLKVSKRLAVDDAQLNLIKIVKHIFQQAVTEPQIIATPAMISTLNNILLIVIRPLGIDEDILELLKKYFDKLTSGLIKDSHSEIVLQLIETILIHLNIIQSAWLVNNKSYQKGLELCKKTLRDVFNKNMQLFLPMLANTVIYLNPKDSFDFYDYAMDLVKDKDIDLYFILMTEKATHLSFSDRINFYSKILNTYRSNPAYFVRALANAMTQVEYDVGLKLYQEARDSKLLDDPELFRQLLTNVTAHAIVECTKKFDDKTELNVRFVQIYYYISQNTLLDHDNRIAFGNKILNITSKCNNAEIFIFILKNIANRFEFKDGTTYYQYALNFAFGCDADLFIRLLGETADYIKSTISDCLAARLLTDLAKNYHCFVAGDMQVFELISNNYNTATKDNLYKPITDLYHTIIITVWNNLHQHLHAAHLTPVIREHFINVHNKFIETFRPIIQPLPLDSIAADNIYRFFVQRNQLTAANTTSTSPTATNLTTIAHRQCNK